MNNRALDWMKFQSIIDLQAGVRPAVATAAAGRARRLRPARAARRGPPPAERDVVAGPARRGARQRRRRRPSADRRHRGRPRRRRDAQGRAEGRWGRDPDSERERAGGVAGVLSCFGSKTSCSSWL